MTVVLIGALVDFVREGFYQALHQGSEGHRVSQIARHVTDPHLDGADEPGPPAQRAQGVVDLFEQLGVLTR